MPETVLIAAVVADAGVARSGRFRVSSGPEKFVLVAGSTFGNSQVMIR